MPPRTPVPSFIYAEAATPELHSFPTRRSSDLNTGRQIARKIEMQNAADAAAVSSAVWIARGMNVISMDNVGMTETDRKSTRLNSSHVETSYAVFCLKKKNTNPAKSFNTLINTS